MLFLHLVVNDGSMLSSVVCALISLVLPRLLLLLLLLLSVVNFLRMVSLLRVEIDLLCLRVDLIVAYNLSDDLSHIFLISQSFQDKSCSWELSVCHVVVPRDAWHGVLWLEHVGNWRVIEDDNVLHVSSKSGEVLNEGVIHESAVLSE